MAKHKDSSAIWLAGGGEMGVMIRAHAWSETPLGAADGWPQSLRSAVSILLPSKAQIVLFWGPELIAIYNDAYTPTMGTKHPWALGRPARDCFSEAWDVLGPLFEGVVKTGEAFWAKEHLFFLNRQGFLEETYYDVSYDPVRIEDGSVGGIFCIVSDQTGRVLGERRLRTLRELGTRTADAKSAVEVCRRAADVLATDWLDAPFTLMYLFDSQGAELVVVSGVNREDVSFPREVAPDTSPLASAREGQPAELAADVFLARVPETAGRRVLVLPLSSGTQIVGALVAGVSRHLRLAGDYRDFFDMAAARISAATTNAQAYEEERRRAEALVELDRAKTAFFSNVSHEFRTPLTLMISPLEDLLAAEDELPGDVATRLDVAHRNSLRLLKLVNTLLDFSRIEAGRIDASYEPVDLAALTAELASVFRSAVERADLQLVVDCEPLPEAVYVDRDMWEKIVLNLLSNAIKFTFEGAIRVALHWRGDYVELSVTDTGIGIPVAELPRVFERFHRVRNARGRTFEGTGIGLALVQELARLHGGTATVESEEGRGSTFVVRIRTGAAHLDHERISARRQLTSTRTSAGLYVDDALRWLPATGLLADELTPITSLSPASSIDASGGAPVRVVLADDNADMRDYLGRILGQYYRVETVADGHAALDRIRADPPDIVLSDVMMPNLDGFGLLAAMRADEGSRSIPVILLSARAGEEARIEGLRAGADDYLVKPFSARELLARVASQLQLARERRESEQALRYRSEQHQTLLNQAPLGIYVVDADFRIREVNPAASRLFGDLPGGVIGRDFGEIIHLISKASVADETVSLFRATLATGKPYVSPEGAEFPTDRGIESYKWRLDRIILPDGRDGVVCYLQDVSERQQAVAAKAYLAAIVDSADDAILSKDLDGVIQSCNAAAERMFGYSSEELVGKPVRMLIPPERQSEEDDILAKIRRGERVDHFETVRMAKDGRRLDIALTVSPVRDTSGNVIGASKIARDISAVKRTEAERIRLLQERAAVMETLNSVGATVASDLDRDTVVQAVTDAATSLTGAEFGAFFYNLIDEKGESYTLYTISGVPREMFSKFPMPRNTEVFEQTFKGTGIVRSPDITRDSRYGHNAPHYGMPAGHLPVRSYLAVPVKGRSGDVVGGLFFGHSATGRFDEQHERFAVGIASWASVALENARMYMSVQETSRIKDDFLASLSHELRTPLNAILGYARMLRSGMVAPDKHQKAIDTIERNATSLTKIVEDVLDISRIVSGKMRLNVQPVEFRTIVRNAVDAVTPAAEAKGLRVETMLDPQIDPVSGDPERLQQVLWNLLSNAVKFTDRGGKVQIRLERVNSHAEVTVSDTGIGIAPEFLPHVFERFRQADAGMSRDRSGLGLGLSIARQLMEMHGGTIEASSPGTDLGATFRLKIPLMIVHPIREEQPRVHPRADPGAPEMPTGDLVLVSVLAVDDEKDALSLVSEVLEGAGARVSTAQSAEEALLRLEAEVPDVIVADLGMPQLDGFHFIARVRRHRNPRVRDVPAAALTAYARPEDRMKALRAGFQIHLTKPIDPAELVTTVASLAKRFIGKNPNDTWP
jgi:PAS domain S-box-containing protein